MTEATAHVAIWKPLALLLEAFNSARIRPTISADSDDEIRARRDCILEMMQSNPEAFQSELDFQCMMHHYPSRHGC
ncbi:hypothetical protein C1J02_05325 [Sulfitobacter sp. SK011]|nr:hypothetical protein C1J02_05325 [Sulfitobacter sp. SK011]